MAKFRRPNLNSWVTPLVLASIGLQGLVMALPMPDLAETPAEPLESVAPEVIQVVTLPKLAKADDSPASPLPEPPIEEFVEEPFEAPVEEIVLAAPEIPEVLEDPTPEPDNLDDSEWNEALETEDDQAPEQPEPEDIPPSLEQRLANVENYGDYNHEQAQRGYTSSSFQTLTSWTENHPGSAPLKDLALTLKVPLIECLAAEPASSALIGITVAPDGTLVDEPEILGKTGYSVLDDKAIELAQQASYPTSDQTKSYWIEIPVEDYTLCSTA